ncbi:MAG TPA: hypothetical protein PLZ57_02205 [Pseudobdellovibrionaceae bacterium]|nr:hypothetical protein [Pseudobdellovibrionaceae bacterium]
MSSTSPTPQKIHSPTSSLKNKLIPLSILIVVLGLPLIGIFYSPDGHGWSKWGDLPLIRLASYDDQDARVHALIVARVLDSPNYDYPIISLGTRRLTYLTQSEIIGITPTSDAEVVGLETHGTLTKGQRYLLLLNAKNEVFDGLELEADGRVRLIDVEKNQALADQPIGGIAFTNPMSVEEAAEKLVGQKFPRIPTRFHP